MQTLHKVQTSFHSMGFDPKLKPFNHHILRIFVTLLPSVILLWIFLIHKANTAQEYMESIYMITTCTGILMSFTSTILIEKKLFLFINDSNETFNERMENPRSRAIYKKTNKFVEKWSKIGMFVLEYVIVSCYIFPKTIFSFFIYFTTDAGNDAFDLPLPMWFPYDWRNPMGYLVTVSMQLLLALHSLHYLGSFTFLAFGVHMFSMALVENLKDELHVINNMANDRKSGRSIYEQLSEFIRIHANAKQLFAAFSDLYEISLTILFTGIIITVCVSLLLVQIEISYNERGSMVLLEAAVFGASALLILLFVCELGQRFSNAIEEVDDTIIQLDWYLFSSKVQRVLSTVMQSTQKAVIIKCFGNVLCSRKQFRKVVKTVYSYFMVLREFYK